jgi:putative N6-adenine-specific DNA methylase
MIGARIAPGMNRTFQGQQWKNLLTEADWKKGFEAARDLADYDTKMDIQGYDIDPQIIKAARENARRAGVDHMIHFQQRPVHKLRHPKKYGFVITNPPYGERMEDKEDMPILYREIGEAFSHLDSWSEFVITAYEDAEKYIGKKATKNRKIYNGMMKTYFYQFLGPKPPRKKERKS